MPLYLDRLDAKLAAIQAKDIAAIAAAHIDIPYLGTDYTEAQLAARLGQLSTWLTNASTLTLAKVTRAKDIVYDSLPAAEKLIADKILAGEDYDLLAASTAANYENLCIMVLYRRITAADG